MALSTLSGNEIVYVNAVQPNGQLAATLEPTTTAAIAALASEFGNDVPSSLATTTGTVIPAADLLTGLLNRTGPTAAFTDTTDTAANIVSTLGGITGGSFRIDIKNFTAFPMTLAAGNGVTISSGTIINPYSVAEFLVVLTSATAVTFNHVLDAPLAVAQEGSITALSTVGAGTITAASFASGFTTRSGAQSGTPFTDTTDTAANIIAACAQLLGKIGASLLYAYGNQTNAVATITGGTGVTVSGITTVAPNTEVEYLVTYTAANTLTVVGIQTGATVNGGAVITPNTVLYQPDTLYSSAQVNAASSTALANVTGLVQNVAAGTYKFRCVLPGTSGASGGVKYAFTYTTATVTSCSISGKAFTASAVAVQYTTATASQTSLISDTAAVILSEIDGEIVFASAGQVTLQFAQNASNATTSSVYQGAIMDFVRTA